ncbi:MAG TPA: DUF2334 domain-containing protein [Candidatus Binatia bacterium]|nr:DUF2334 domain-containing protein [Candidatus Binatia bacterium]
MRYVILRDDDTNALTPVECLERLHRPFLDRGMPVNLAIIPNVRTDTKGSDGQPEGFLLARPKDSLAPGGLPISGNKALVRYLRDNSGYHKLQHGYDHSLSEFDSEHADDIRRRLKQGARLLMEAGFPRPETFVAPYDKFSPLSLREVARHFRVISAGPFALSQLPFSWWPKYALNKISRRSHWRIGRTLLLAHPGCRLSHQRPCETMLDEVKRSVEQRELTVLVTQWWEYFRFRQPNEPFLRVLHEIADWLASQPDLKVVSFVDLLNLEVRGQKSEVRSQK